MHTHKRILLIFGAAFVAAAGTLLLLTVMGGAAQAGPPRRAQPAAAATTRYVATTGVDTIAIPDWPYFAPNFCAMVNNPCRTVQHAVDCAAPGDGILVATGVYADVQARGGVTQVVYISKTVTVRGGYTSTGWIHDPLAYPTTLDAEGQGRVVYITGTGDISPTLEGLTIARGNATGQTADCAADYRPDGCGGGIFVYRAQPIIVNNVITNNVAAVTSAGYPTGTTGYGGGIYLVYAYGAVISGNVIISNVGSLTNNGEGGGLHLRESNALVQSNQVISNCGTTTSSTVTAAWGGGISMHGGQPVIRGNLIQGNWPRLTDFDWMAMGGGFYQNTGYGTLLDNRIVNNHGESAVYLSNSGALFEGNQVVDNATSVGIEMGYRGPTLINNVVARSGDTSLLAYGTIGYPLTATLLHNTLVGSGTGYGVYVESGYVALSLSNTIVASHTWGITNTVPASSTVIADHALFWANDHDGLRGTHPVDGDPAFAPDGYHLAAGSAAIDAGVNAGVTTDVDGDPRPVGAGYDIGADEYVSHIYLPLVLR